MRGAPAQPAGDATHREQVIVALCAVLLLCVGYAWTVERGPVSHFDHALYVDTLERQRDGEGYYDAYLGAFADRDITLSEVRAVRQPAPFWLWASVPQSWLWPLYAVGLVGGVCAVLLLGVTRSPLAVLPVAAYLLLAGRIPSTPGVEQWLLVELWTLLPLAGSIACWRRGPPWCAAALAMVAVLMRETAAGFLAVGLVLAWRSGDRRERTAWTLAAVGAAAGYGAHAVAAASRLADRGQDAVILGTGDPPRTIWEMAAWMVPGPDLVGVVVVALGLLHLLRRRTDLRPLLGLFALAGAGVFVARPYWGFLFIPFGILLCGEWAGSVASRASQRRAGAAASGG